MDIQSSLRIVAQRCKINIKFTITATKPEHKIEYCYTFLLIQLYYIK